MIEDPDRWAPGYAEAGRAERHHPRRGRPVAGPARCGRSARPAPAPGWRINPATPVEPYADLLPEIDMLLLMTVEPGFGGQPFLDLVLAKLRRARALIAGHGGRGVAAGGRRGQRGDYRAVRGGRRGRVRGRARPSTSADDPAAAVRSLRAQAERAAGS